MTVPTAFLDRRTFLVRLERAACAATLGARAVLPLLASACASIPYIRGTGLGAELLVPQRELGSATQAMIERAGGELPIFVRRLDDGSWLALSTRCMHRGCQVEPTDDRLVCPCHGSEYDLNGGVLQGPTERALVRYRVTRRDDGLVVHLTSAAS